MKRFLIVLIVAAAGCVPLPPEDAGSGATQRSVTKRVFDDLDPGSKEQVSLHFRVAAYDSDKTRVVSELCERLYSKIMQDTALYSFLPREPYHITLYANREEYLRKTGLPEWSGGVSVGNAIYAYEGPRLSGVLAHEMTHLIFREYLGRDDLTLRWVNEGLAVYEEQEAMIQAGFAPAGVVGRKVSFQEMTLLAPMDESQRDVSSWYQQVGSVVRFMIERGGRIGFGQFMRALKDGQRPTDAVRTGFPAQWQSMDELENVWGLGR